MNNDIRNLLKWLNEEQETPLDRQALARVLAMAEQEPVVVRDVLVKIARFLGVVRVYAQDTPPKQELETDKPLHWKARELQDEVIRLLDTSPPAQRQARSADTWVWLKDEEIVTLFNKTLDGKPLDVNSMTNFARSIEAKLREKNGITKEQT